MSEESEGNERKTHKITEFEYQKLKVANIRETQVYKDQIKRNRENQLKHLRVEIVKLDREIAFKEQQLKTGIVLEKHPDFDDGLKPKFFLENDIDVLKLAKEDALLQISDVEQAAKEDEK